MEKEQSQSRIHPCILIPACCSAIPFPFPTLPSPSSPTLPLLSSLPKGSQ